MRVLVAKDRQILPGQEALFRRLVLKNAQELAAIDSWLRQSIPSYLEEMTLNPITSWVIESEEELFAMAEEFGTGEVFFDDSTFPAYYDERKV